MDHTSPWRHIVHFKRDKRALCPWTSYIQVVLEVEAVDQSGPSNGGSWHSVRLGAGLTRLAARSLWLRSQADGVSSTHAPCAAGSGFRFPLISLSTSRLENHITHSLTMLINLAENLLNSWILRIKVLFYITEAMCRAILKLICNDYVSNISRSRSPWTH